MPIEFTHIAPCDGLADGTLGMHWILPSRDIIAASIEMMVQTQRVDGIVALSTCDKIVPAQVMALARINLPALMVTGGYMLSGRFRDQKIEIQHINEMYPVWKEGKLRDEEFKQIEDNVCPTCGACCMMGTGPHHVLHDRGDGDVSSREWDGMCDKGIRPSARTGSRSESYGVD
jgi:dihydroxy-acid dehydratase